jgi:hypothetical protein
MPVAPSGAALLTTVRDEGGAGGMGVVDEVETSEHADSDIIVTNAGAMYFSDLANVLNNFGNPCM